MKRVLLATAALLVIPAALDAQNGERPVVEVVASGEPEIRQAMAERIGSLESRFPVAVRFTTATAIDVREVVAPLAAGEPVLARVWLDMSAPGRAVLFIANAGHDRFLVRVVPVSEGYGELTRESLATVVESAIDAMLAGGQIGVERGEAVRELEAQTGTQIAVEPKPTAPAPVAAAEPAPMREAPHAPSGSSRGPWSLAVHYRADAIADGPTLRHGMQLALGYAAGLGRTVDLLLMLTTQLAPAFSLGDGGRRVESYGGGARLCVGATSGTRGVLGWQAGLGAGVDLLRVEPAIDAESGLVGADPFLLASPVATAFVSGAIRPASWFHVALGVGLDVALLDQHFDVDVEGDRTPLFAPRRARPHAFVGVGIPFGERAER